MTRTLYLKLLGREKGGLHLLLSPWKPGLENPDAHFLTWLQERVLNMETQETCRINPSDHQA